MSFASIALLAASSSDSDGGFLPMLFSCCCGGFVCVGLFGLVPFLGLMKIFAKAGEPGWAAFVPVYNMMVAAKIAGKEPNFGLLTLIPGYGIYVAFVIFSEMAVRFGKDAMYAIGILLLPFIFLPMLGFGSARYSLGSRRRRDNDDEDRPRRSRDDDEDRPRRPRDDDEDRPRRR